MTKDKLVTGIQNAINLNAVPKEKFSSMVARTITGVFLALIGGGLLYVMGRLALASDQPSAVLVIVLLSAGGGLILLGGHMVSGQVRAGLLDLVNPVKKLRGAIKGERE